MKRSDEILLVGYWLSRRSNPVTGAPPAALGVRYWKQAYESFAHLKGGRTLPTFINSLRNTRDQFDAILPTARRGWFDTQSNPAAGEQLCALHERWRKVSDAELDRAVLLITPQTIS